MSLLPASRRSWADFTPFVRAARLATDARAREDGRNRPERLEPNCGTLNPADARRNGSHHLGRYPADAPNGLNPVRVSLGHHVEQSADDREECHAQAVELGVAVEGVGRGLHRLHPVRGGCAPARPALPHPAILAVPRSEPQRPVVHGEHDAAGLSSHRSAAPFLRCANAQGLPDRRLRHAEPRLRAPHRRGPGSALAGRARLVAASLFLLFAAAWFASVVMQQAPALSMWLVVGGRR